MPHYLSLDIALDITALADSDSILDCQRGPKKSDLLLLYSVTKHTVCIRHLVNIGGESECVKANTNADFF